MVYGPSHAFGGQITELFPFASVKLSLINLTAMTVGLNCMQRQIIQNVLTIMYFESEEEKHLLA